MGGWDYYIDNRPSLTKHEPTKDMDRAKLNAEEALALRLSTALGELHNAR